MSKIVVGMNSNPATTPHRIDCGFPSTAPMARDASLMKLLCLDVGACDGSSVSSAPPMTSAATPITAQNMYQGVPDPISGLTTNWPAEPPAIPNNYVAPIDVHDHDARLLAVPINNRATNENT